MRAEASRWAVDEPNPLAGAAEAHVVIGLVFNPETFRRAVDTGPAADSPQSASFRNFWGGRAELRRFADGSILESVVWNRPPAQAHLIVEDIAAFTLERHGGVSADGL